MTTIDLADARTQRALLIAADAGQWARCHLADGRKAYAVPSSKDSDHRYLTTTTSCTCPDYTYGNGRACKHVRAVAIYCALVRVVQPAPKPAAADAAFWKKFEGD